MLILSSFRFLRFLTLSFVFLFVNNAFSNERVVRPSLLDSMPLDSKENSSFEKKNTNKYNPKEKKIVKSLSPSKPPSKKYKKVRKISRTFNFNKLPRRYNHWLLDVVKPNHLGGQRCVLRSNATKMSDDYLATPIVLEVFSDLIKISGQSPIDLSYSNLGIKIDAFDRISIDAIVGETNAIFFIETSTLITQMVKGHKLEVVLGFIPTNSLDQSYSTKISLEGFSNGIRKLSECEKKLNHINI